MTTSDTDTNGQYRSLSESFDCLHEAVDTLNRQVIRVTLILAFTAGFLLGIFVGVIA